MTDRDKLIELIKQIRGNEIALADYEADALIDHLIANGVTVNEWRPASEPPEEFGEYNVMVEGGTVATTLFYSKLNKGWFEFNDDDYMFPCTVTHWMPLPKPPKEVE